jgi:hypothetical protein
VAKSGGFRNDPQTPRDPNQLAKSIIDIATGEKPDRDPTPEEQGKKAVAGTSGSKGGKLRAALLSPEERQRIARKAAKARWEASPAPGRAGAEGEEIGG